jgi:hypothetical protein
MGCHTWFYKKVDLTLDEFYEKEIKSVKKDLNYSLKTQEKVDKLGINEYLKQNPNSPWEVKDLRNLHYDINNTKYVLSVLESRTLNLNDYLEDTFSYYVYIEGKGFYVDTDYHDLFRIYGYPEDKLFSLKETLDFITKYEKENDVKVEVEMNLLKEFWDEFPDGMIDFG